MTTNLTPADVYDHHARSPALRRARTLGLAALSLLLVAAGVRTYVNAAHAEEVVQRTADTAVRTVLTTEVKPGQSLREVALPATLRGRNEAAIHARTNGYVREWRKDIGDKVRRGEVLAIIDTPEVDQDLAQARAAQAQIQARLTLATSTLARWEGLRDSNAVSQQEVDERRAALQQAQADLEAAQANVARLQQLHDFGIITAPFDGVVVRRNVDVGALIAAGSATSNRELFYLAQTTDLRLTVAVPQVYASDVAVGKDVGIKLLEQPNLPLKGRIARISGGVDTATRAVQVEVAIANQDGALLPGAYVEVSLPLQGAARALLVPPNTLQFRQDGPRVAVVGEGGTVDLRPVKLGRDLGRSVEITSGLNANEVVILNPHDAIEAGEKVLAKALSEEASGDKAPAGKGKPPGKA